MKEKDKYLPSNQPAPTSLPIPKTDYAQKKKDL
jgi:hypothetical protein